MAHYMTMFAPSKYIAAHELGGKDHTLTIAKVEAGEVESMGATEKKCIVTFKEAQKPLAANKTNARAIASMYSNDTTKWVGQRITIYPTTTRLKGETVECVRVKNVRPQGEAQ
jgi:CRISPR/Cas system-associated protein Cas5 (RAMP superfamily)